MLKCSRAFRLQILVRLKEYWIPECWSKGQLETQEVKNWW